VVSADDAMMWVDSHPGLLSIPSAFAHCASPFRLVGLLWSGYNGPATCVLYLMCAESDGASMISPLEPSRRPPSSVARSLVHYGRGCIAGFRPRGLRTAPYSCLLLPRWRERAREGEKQRCKHIRQAKQASGKYSSECSVPDCLSTRLEVWLLAIHG